MQILALFEQKYSPSFYGLESINHHNLKKSTVVFCDPYRPYKQNQVRLALGQDMHTGLLPDP